MRWTFFNRQLLDVRKTFGRVHTKLKSLLHIFYLNIFMSMYIRFTFFDDTCHFDFSVSQIPLFCDKYTHFTYCLWLASRIPVCESPCRTAVGSPSQIGMQVQSQCEHREMQRLGQTHMRLQTHTSTLVTKKIWDTIRGLNIQKSYRIELDVVWFIVESWWFVGLNFELLSTNGFLKYSLLDLAAFL